MSEDVTIGFIGLGTMGESMCENILKAGFKVNIYDIDQNKIKLLEKYGGIPCKSIKEISEKSNRIIIMVPTNDNVRDVITALLPHLNKGTIVIDMSTISPSVSREMAEFINKSGSKMIDAPVVKSKGAAITATLGILVGGDQEVLDKVRPILECMGKEIIHLGSNGNGLIMKLCHNMLVGGIQNAVNETLLLAQQAGLDFDKTVQSIRAGGGQNFYLDAKAESIKNKDFSPKFSIQNMHKDIHLAMTLVKELGLLLPAAEMVRNIYDKSISEFSKEDFSATIKTVERNLKE